MVLLHYGNLRQQNELLFHDENNSGYMDQNFIGIPLEPYSFSVPYSSKFRVPKFDDVKFEFNHPNQVVETELGRW